MFTRRLAELIDLIWMSTEISIRKQSKLPNGRTHTETLYEGLRNLKPIPNNILYMYAESMTTDPDEDIIIIYVE